MDKPVSGRIRIFIRDNLGYSGTLKIKEGLRGSLSDDRSPKNDFWMGCFGG